MPKSVAIKTVSLSKDYVLHGSRKDQFLDAIGLRRVGWKPHQEPRRFGALKDVSIEIIRGSRLGIIGRNGAGKTTLLKLICGNVTPSSGQVEINGAVQALMTAGLGFSMEQTGLENIQTSLLYNGLSRKDRDLALQDIIDFCELGDFLEQPIKTYSSGMQARLAFGAATAVKPDILIVDEMLGAGDAYFIAKSSRRVAKLIGNGCTMVLVSHSMAQVLEMCDEVMWLHDGRVKMYGQALKVVKAYEEFLNEPIQQLDNQEFTVATLDREQDPTTSSPNVEEGQAEQRSENPVEADEALSPDNLVSVDLPGQGSGSTMEGTEIWESGSQRVSSETKSASLTTVREVISGADLESDSLDLDTGEIEAIAEEGDTERLLNSGLLEASTEGSLQIPGWINSEPEIPCGGLRAILDKLPNDSFGFDFVAEGGISRWGEPDRLEIVGFTICSDQGKMNKVMALKACAMCVRIKALKDYEGSGRLIFHLYEYNGKSILNPKSGSIPITLEKDRTATIATVFDPLQLGPGTYLISAAIFEFANLNRQHIAPRLDLLSRSFSLEVEQNNVLTSGGANFIQPSLSKIY